MHIAILNEASNFHGQKWAAALQKAGARVSIFSFESYQHPDFHCITIPFSRILGKTPNILHYLTSGKRLATLLEAHEVEVVFAINITPFGILAMRSGFRPVICFAVGADILEFPPRNQISAHLQARNWSNHEPNYSLLGKIKYHIRYHLFRRWVRQSLHFCAGIMADNEVLVEAIRDWFHIPATKIRLNRGGVEPELFQATPEKLEEIRTRFHIPEGKKVCFFPRGLKPIYQGDVIAAALSPLLEENKDTYFIVLGTYTQVPDSVDKLLNTLAKQHDNLYYCKEPIAREDMYALWNFIDVFVSAPIYDGYSASVAEGRFVGAIPIVNDTAATRELFEHKKNAWVVEPLDALNLAKEISYVLGHLTEIKPIFAEANREWVLRHSVMSRSAEEVIDWARELDRLS